MKNQTGLSLIEIMISLTIGLILLAAILSLYGVVVNSSTATLRSVRLNHDMEAIMNLMINEIRRAGYWGNATVNANSLENPFTSGKADINIPNTGCILYSYDGGTSTNESNGNIENNEYFGFKLGNNNAIMMRLSITDPAASDSCDHGRWESFTNENEITITNLSFTSSILLDDRCLNFTANPTRTCSSAITNDDLAEKRIIDVSMTGRLASDSSITHTLTSRIEVRNNRLYTVD